jgi:YbgC/YbaW family acyl-CoA thioester hydrolase
MNTKDDGALARRAGDVMLRDDAIAAKHSRRLSHRQADAGDLGRGVIHDVIIAFSYGQARGVSFPAMTGQRSPFVISEYVRWGDIDLAGIICYGAYIRFYELAETEIFRSVGLPFKEMFDRHDIWLPRKVMHTEFHSPALLDERLAVLTYFSRVGTTSLTINFDVMDAERGVLHATAYQVLVCVTREQLAKRPLPQEVIDAIGPYVMTAEEARASKAAQPVGGSAGNKASSR